MLNSGGAGLKLLFALALCVLSPGLSLATETGTDTLAAATRVVGSTRLTSRGDTITLALEFDKTPAYALHYVDQPPRLILDLPSTVFAHRDDTLPDSMLKGQGLVKSVRYGTMAEGSARMVVTLTHPVKVTNTRILPAPDGVAGALVLEGEKIGDEDFRALLASQTWEDPHEAKKDIGASALSVPAPEAGFVIAVDAGHGGIDTGATTPDGKIVEKDLTLAFARKLVEKLNAIPGLHAFLTRDKDEFISLSHRVEIARQRKANLFISFHADKLKQNSIRGATVYTISDRASDSLAANLAERENLSDELAGLKVSDEPEEVADILLDLTRRETQAFSVTFAQSVIQSFKGQIELINNPHRSAGFIVLGAPEIPSILLELGFLSNKQDAGLLSDPQWQEKIGSLMTDAIRTFQAPRAAEGSGQGG